MKCSDVLEALSGSAEVSREIQLHLDGCETCRAFATDVRTIRRLCDSPVTTPAALRRRTLDQSLALLAEQSSGEPLKPLQRSPARVSPPPYIVAAAIAALLLLAALEIFQVTDMQDKTMSTSIILTLILFGVQNFVTALFLPALLKMKSRLRGTQT